MDEKKILKAVIKASIEQEDVETDEAVIHGLRVESEVGDLKDSAFHPVEAEEK